MGLFSLFSLFSLFGPARNNRCNRCNQCANAANVVNIAGIANTPATNYVYENNVSTYAVVPMQVVRGQGYGLNSYSNGSTRSCGCGR